MDELEVKLEISMEEAIEIGANEAEKYTLTKHNTCNNIITGVMFWLMI